MEANARQCLIECIASKINEYGVGSLEHSIAIGRTVFEYLDRNGHLTMHPSEDYSIPHKAPTVETLPKDATINKDGTVTYTEQNLSIDPEPRVTALEKFTATDHNRIEQLERRLDELQASFDGIVSGSLHSIKMAVNDMIGENYIAKADHEKRISELLESNTKLHHQNVGLLDRIAYLDKQIVELLQLIEDSNRTNEFLLKENSSLRSELLKTEAVHKAMNKATED